MAAPAFKEPFVSSPPVTKAMWCFSPFPSFPCQPCTTPAGTWRPPPVMTKPWGSCVGRTLKPATPPTGSSTCSIRTTARRLSPSHPFSQVDSQVWHIYDVALEPRNLSLRQEDKQIQITSSWTLSPVREVTRTFSPHPLVNLGAGSEHGGGGIAFRCCYPIERMSLGFCFVFFKSQSIREAF